MLAGGIHIVNTPQPAYNGYTVNNPRESQGKIFVGTSIPVMIAGSVMLGIGLRKNKKSVAGKEL